MLRVGLKKSTVKDSNGELQQAPGTLNWIDGTTVASDAPHMGDVVMDQQDARSFVIDNGQYNDYLESNILGFVCQAKFTNGSP